MNGNHANITDKEWLDLAWKYFQQHAQQRMLYFNYFVAFSTVLTTGLIASFQPTFQMPYLGIVMGFLQSFLAFFFLKIDQRNKFLTHHSERLIIKIENDYEQLGKAPYRLFYDENISTQTQKHADKNVRFYNRMITHGRAYKIIYLVFFFLGIAGMISSTIYCSSIDNNGKNKPSLECNNTNDSILNALLIKTYQLDRKIDSFICQRNQANRDTTTPKKASKLNENDTTLRNSFRTSKNS